MIAYRAWQIPAKVVGVAVPGIAVAKTAPIVANAVAEAGRKSKKGG